MAQLDNDIAAEGIQIVWVLMQDRLFRAGTADRCRDYIRSISGDVGLCVGDSETRPMADAFGDSDIAIGRGYDVLVRRSDMKVVYATTHGTPGGNETLTGQQLLDNIRRVISGG